MNRPQTVAWPAWGAASDWLAVSSWCALSSLVHTTAARTRADNEPASNLRGKTIAQVNPETGKPLMRQKSGLRAVLEQARAAESPAKNIGKIDLAEIARQQRDLSGFTVDQ